MKVMFRGIAMLCILQLSMFAGSALSQERDGGSADNHKFLYGIQLGYTGNEIDVYSNQGGTLHVSENGPYYTSGLRIAVSGEARLGRCFSLRVMPGVSLIRQIKLESVRSELPVDVKFHPGRIGNLEPYITSGLGYGYDFASLRDDGNYYLKPLNAHDLRYTCGLGVDWYTRFVIVGLEFKAGFGLLPPGDGGENFSYFHNKKSFCIGLNFSM